jgi:hypothetical protein
MYYPIAKGAEACPFALVYRDKIALRNKKQDFNTNEYIELIRASGMVYKEHEQEKKDERETLCLLRKKVGL